MKTGVIKAILCAISLISVVVLLGVVFYILMAGARVVSPGFLFRSPDYINFEEGGIFPQIVGSLYLLAVSLLFAVPLGVASGIYLAEYAPRNIVTMCTRLFVECLAGIPSVVIGLFGLTFFVYYLGFGPSVLSGGLSLGIMILPWTVRASEEAIKSVPSTYRAASLALGASKWQTIRLVVLKSAYPGMITGILLGAGKAIGEAAIVLLTTGGLATFLPHSLFDDVGSLPVYIYLVLTVIPASREIGEAYAFGASLVLIGIFLCISIFALLLRNRYIKRLRGE